MTVTIAALGTLPANPIVPGSRRSRMVKLTFDSSYPTGGYALTAALFGLTQLDAVTVHGSSLLGIPVSYDSANAKLKLFSAVGTEVSNATDKSTDSILVTASGL